MEPFATKVFGNSKHPSARGGVPGFGERSLPKGSRISQCQKPKCQTSAPVLQTDYSGNQYRAKELPRLATLCVSKSAQLADKWSCLKSFLKDSLLPLDKNPAKQVLLLGVLGRKNFLSNRSIGGAKIAAILNSICMSCALSAVNPKLNHCAHPQLPRFPPPTRLCQPTRNPKPGLIKNSIGWSKSQGSLTSRQSQW